MAEVEVGEGLGALDRKSALHVSVYVVDRRSCVNGLRKFDIKMSGVGISRNLSAELHLVQRQVYDCYTAVKRQRKCAWPVQRETGSPHWQSFEMTRNLSLMWSLPSNSCVAVVVNGFIDAGFCVVYGVVAELQQVVFKLAISLPVAARRNRIVSRGRLPAYRWLRTALSSLG